MVSEAFGVGANGPMLIAAELPAARDLGTVNDLTAQLRTTPGVAAVLPPQVNTAGDTALLTLIPTTSPQDPATERLLERLRTDVVPDVVEGTGTTVHVGGIAAASVDITDNIASRLPALIAGVVGLSFLLLVVTFRSLAVAVKAAAVNLLSIGAAYGVVALVLEGGWAGQLVGIEAETPLPAFIPVLMFAVLFGLSMDYEVFLLSRMREGWLRTRNNSESVASGLAITARVITAAAAIMARGVRRLRAERRHPPEGDRHRDGDGDPGGRHHRPHAAGARRHAAHGQRQLVAAGSDRAALAATARRGTPGAVPARTDPRCHSGGAAAREGAAVG